MDRERRWDTRKLTTNRVQGRKISSQTSTKRQVTWPCSLKNHPKERKEYMCADFCKGHYVPQENSPSQLKTSVSIKCTDLNWHGNKAPPHAGWLKPKLGRTTRTRAADCCQQRGAQFRSFVGVSKLRPDEIRQPWQMNADVSLCQLGNYKQHLAQGDQNSS